MSTSLTTRAARAATHFLCYPLYNPRSSLQLQNLVQRLRDDEQAAGCPQKAFRLPQSLCVRIIPLNLRVGHDLEAVLQLLRSLDIHQMLRQAETAAAAGNASNDEGTSTKAVVAGLDHRERVPPLYVSLTGSSSLYAIPRPGLFFGVSIDSTNRLRFLSSQIFRRFRSMGFYERLPGQIEESSFMLIDTGQARKSQLLVDQYGRKISKLLKSDFNPQGLIDKYTDVVLAESIPLEKLSLCKSARVSKFLGPRNEVLIADYYEEVDSVPLPQGA